MKFTEIARGEGILVSAESISCLLDSVTNIITPLMPYFPLVLVFAQKYVKDTGIGTIVSLMLPYSIAFFVTWVIFLTIYWLLGFPLGLQAPYSYP